MHRHMEGQAESSITPKTLVLLGINILEKMLVTHSCLSIFFLPSPGIAIKF